MSDKKFDLSEIIGFYITLCWLAFWFAILYMKIDFDKLVLGDIGAYIAGIFAPIAWLWFYLSYRLQRQSLNKQVEELSLQRDELSLQRLAIEQSVVTQQGSEKALTKQSQVLQKQLEITSRQFEYYLQDRDAQRPSFEIEDYQLFTKSKDSNYRPITNLGIIPTQVPDYFRIILSNYKADCTIKSIKILKSDNSLTINSFPNLKVDAAAADRFKEKVNENTEYITFIVEGFNREVDIHAYRKALIEKLEWTIFMINYSYIGISASDVYEFYLENEELKTRLLEGD